MDQQDFATLSVHLGLGPRQPTFAPQMALPQDFIQLYVMGQEIYGQLTLPAATLANFTNKSFLRTIKLSGMQRLVVL